MSQDPAFTSDGQWFQLQRWDGVHITVKELLPIVLGVAVWDSRWKGLTVTCRSDNAAVVAIVNSGRSKMDRAMRLTRCLSFLAKGGGCPYHADMALALRMVLLRRTFLCR